MIGVYVTCRNEKEARIIARGLLGKRLVGCANIFPVDSMYWWKGKIAEDKECVILAKTLERNFPGVVTEVKKLHSYDVPCIIRIPESANKDYADWLKGEVI